MKRAAALLLAVLLCLTALPFAGAAEDGRGKLPQEFTAGTPVSAYADGNLTVVLMQDGTLWASGLHHGIYYQPFTKITEDVQSFSVSTSVLGYIKKDGSFWMADFNGIYGSKTFTKMLDNAKTAIINDRNALVLKNDGTVWGWGSDLTEDVFPIDVHSLPSSILDDDGWNIFVTQPVQMMSDVQEIAECYEGAFFLKTDGTLYGIGTVNSGLLCDTKFDNDYGTTTPQKLLDKVKHICASKRACYVIREDDSLWGWGKLPWTTQQMPLKLADKVKDAVETDRTLAYVTTSGDVWAYGDTLPGCAGNAKSNAKQTALTKVDKLFGTTYSDHGLALRTDGSLWAWGHTGMTDSGTDAPFYNVYNSDEYGTQITDYLQIAGPDSTLSAKPAVKPAATAAASPTSAKVLVNGKQVAFDAYNIGNSNYFKLRDLAMALNGSEKQFAVSWAGQSVSLQSGAAYTPVGGELKTGKAKQQTAKLSAFSISLDGAPAEVTAYNIGGSNYLRLRDLGQLIDFGVDWDGTAKLISIRTDKGYAA